uniref:Nucleoplasmin-like domain-containing protein n=1 Tax=Brassica oleracea TaxID=3712 RepID=A0A3P6E9E2_BRAOL|nr:unnamed protein product [Brassica oleracea]
MPLKVRPQVDHLIHLSQATIDGAKKGESGLLYVNIDWNKYVIGTLSQDHIPQISFDLVFEQEFELSHSLSQGSVHFVGYKSPNIDQEDYPSDSEEEEVLAVPATSNVVKADSKPKAKPAEVKPESDEDEDDESEEDEDDSEDDGPDPEKVMEVEDSEEEETPKQPAPSNKRTATASVSKTPVPAKKTKTAVAATPQKTVSEEKKKGGHAATPHPAKKGGKNANQNPKSGGQSSGGNNKQGNKGKGKGKGRA